MKKFFLLILSLVISLVSGYSQTPQAIKYQAVARDASGDLITNQAIAIQLSLIQGSASGTIVYTETHSLTTNNYGLFDLEVGNGTVGSGNFETINWSQGVYFLQIEMDETGGNTFLSMGTSQLLSVPYALYAENAGFSEDGDWTLDADTLYSAVDSTVTIKGGKVGIGTPSPKADFHVAGTDGVLFTGIYDSGAIPEEGAGTRMLWYPKKSAFRVGTADGSEWDDVNIGNYSVAMGWNVLASDYFSTAIGLGNTASGTSSLSLGENTTASGHLATAMGYNTTASGDYSLTTGFGIEASGNYSVAIGLSNQNGTNVTNNNTMAIMGGKVGIGTVSPTADLHVAGIDGALFTGTYDSGAIPAEGAGTRMMWYPKKGAFRAGRIDGNQWDEINIGVNSTAIGYNTTASHVASTAMGTNTTASANYSTAMGIGSTASGLISTAMGYYTTASGYSSTAVGEGTTASGDFSFAIGSGIEASGDYSVAISLSTLNSTNVSQNNTLAIMGGLVGIGTVAPLRMFEVHDNINSYIAMFKNAETQIGDGIRISLGPVNPTSDNRFIDFLRNGGGNYAGWICGNGSGQVLYSTTSDARLKTNIIDYQGALDMVSKIGVKQYEMKSAPGIEQIGFIAQDLIRIYPQAVSGDPNGDVDEAPMGVDYGNITPLLVKAIQEQQEQIAALQAEIELLKYGSKNDDDLD